MIGSNLIYILLAIVAGIAVTFQGPISSTLGAITKSNDFATLWSFIGGSIVVVIYFLVKRQGLPDISLLKSAPLWSYLGAVTGIIYVSLVILVIPKLGVGNATIILLISQVITALLLDHFGAFGFPVKPLTLMKLTGVALMIGGIYLINK